MHLANGAQQTGLAIHAEGGQEVLDDAIEQDTFAAMKDVLEASGQLWKLQRVFYFKGLAALLLAEVALASLHVQIASDIFAHQLASAVAEGAGEEGQVSQRILVVRQAELVKVN